MRDAPPSLTRAGCGDTKSLAGWREQALEVAQEHSWRRHRLARGTEARASFGNGCEFGVVANFGLEIQKLRICESKFGVANSGSVGSGR